MNYCEETHRMFNGLPRHTFPFIDESIPLNGIYILFESGEKGHGGNRIVRVGTHTGENQLRSRLKQHFMRENKDRSIFRKNIGRALLQKQGDPFIQYWEIDLTPRKNKEKYANRIDFEKQRQIEKQVTEYIQSMFTFVVFEVEDKATRLSLESKLISTVSLCRECSPSKDWLGLSSPKDKIRESGLWLVNELYKEPLSKADISKLISIIKN
ncbi:hypothetical protein ACFL0B_07580 [Thermodesulfobacteriota bacterium]